MLTTFYKILFFAPRFFMNIRPVLTYIVLLFLCISSESFSAETEWKLFLNTSNSSPIITATTSENEEFIINNTDVSGISGSEDILEALEGTKFVQSSPVNGSLTIHIILNVQGNSFQSINGKALSLNMNIEAFVDGNKIENLPLTMTIPAGDGLDYLLGLSGCNRSDIVFAYYFGGELDNSGIETLSKVQGIVVNINSLSTIVGGKNSVLGFPANIEYSTWYKIKKLFE